jgi:glutamyl-tRNA reductase
MLAYACELTEAPQHPVMPGGLGDHQMLAMVGVSYRTAPVALREQLAFGPQRLPLALHALAEHPDVSEAFLLSTCNRTELYVVVTATDAWRTFLRNLIASQSDATPCAIEDSLYWHAGEDAARHLFRVAAGLDSMVLGEAEIVNQIKIASTAAREAEATGTILHRLVEKALAASKRARTEVRYDGCGLSVASIAVTACKQNFTDLSDIAVMVLGAGETAELTVHYLASKGVRKIIVANRTFERADVLARLAGGEAVAFPDYPSRLAEVDMVICCTASPHPVLRAEMVAPAMTARPDRRLLVVDIAVPRDVEPAVAEIPGVTLMNIDTLQGCALESVEQRQAKLIAAEEIVTAEAREFGKWLSSRRAIAVITELRGRIDAIRADVNSRLATQLDLPDATRREIIDRATDALVEDILREAIGAMQQFTGAPNASHSMEIVRRLLDSR